MKMFLVFLLLGVCTETWTSCSVCTNIDNFKDRIERNRVHNSTYETLAQYGLLRCVKQCLLRKRCLSINLELSSQTCHLNDHTGQQNGTTYKQGSIFTLKDSWPQVIAGECRNHDCSYGMMCVDESPTGFVCKTENEHNKRIYNKYIHQWSNEMSGFKPTEFFDITVVKGLIIIISEMSKYINGYYINKTLALACRYVEISNHEIFAVQKFGDKILIQYLDSKKMLVLNVDLKSITPDYNIDTDFPYKKLAVVDNTTLVGIRRPSDNMLDILRINGKRATIFQTIAVTRSTCVSVMQDFNIIITSDEKNIICLDQYGLIRWNVSNYMFSAINYIHTDNHGNLFVINKYKLNVVHLEQSGKYFIIPTSGEIADSIFVDENGIGYVLTTDENRNGLKYIHVYLFN